MAATKKIRVAIVGLGFGAEFIPIYQAHPNAEMYAVCRRNKAELDASGDKFGIKESLHRLCQSCSPIPTSMPCISTRRFPIMRRRAWPRLKVGKHVATCTVPMATSVESRKQLVEAQRASGKVYMMMETVVYSREYLFAEGTLRQRRPGPVSSSLRDSSISRTWTAGPATGLACRRCTTPRTASSRRASPLSASTPRERRLPRLRPHPRPVCQDSQNPIRQRDGDL